jgi:N6-adenosine-specific RNA methylase IME4
MTMLAAYDRARIALADAVRVDEVMAIRDELEHVKLYARQIQDKALLADATIFQMRAERRLGILLAAAKEAGQIVEGRIAKGRRVEPNPDRVTLKEIGVDKKLSARAQKAAALADGAFEQLAESARDKIKSGGAILVDPINVAAKEAEIAGRRASHAARTKDGGKVEDLHELAASGFRAGFIGMDPQWHFLTRSAAGEGRSAGAHYKTEEVEKIKNIPVGALAAENAALGMWAVDWCLQDAFDLMRHYGFNVITKLYTWVKTNGDGDLLAYDDSTWHMGMGYWTRANPEDCWLGTRGDPKRLYADVRQLIVAPLMEHSRKPDAWLERAERLVEGPYLELNARRTRPGWISWGDELEFTGVAA